MKSKITILPRMEVVGVNTIMQLPHYATHNAHKGTDIIYKGP